jgi:hypothetical protein
MKMQTVSLLAQEREYAFCVILIVDGVDMDLVNV